MKIVLYFCMLLFCAKVVQRFNKKKKYYIWAIMQGYFDKQLFTFKILQKFSNTTKICSQNF